MGTFLNPSEWHYATSADTDAWRARCIRPGCLAHSAFVRIPDDKPGLHIPYCTEHAHRLCPNVALAALLNEAGATSPEPAATPLGEVHV